MVAITVILAAVIAAFVLDMGDSMGDSSPTASVDVSTNSDFNPNDGGSPDPELFYVSHASGDSIPASELDVVLRDSDGKSVAKLAADGGSDNLDGDSDITVDSTLSEEFGSGATITVEITETNSASDYFYTTYSDEEMEVQLVHTPSDTTLTGSTHTVPNR